LSSLKPYGQVSPAADGINVATVMGGDEETGIRDISGSEKPGSECGFPAILPPILTLPVHKKSE
jgi:hypothetical protein